MASMSKIIVDLQAEMTARIIDLVSSAQAAVRFAPRTVQERNAKQDMSQAIPRARLFEVGEPNGIPEPHFIAYTARSALYNFPIKIWYPTNTISWRRAPWEDTDIIGQDFREHSAIVTGCHYRVVNLNASPEFTPVDKDEWTLATINVKALLEAGVTAGGGGG